jgi:hypothetical protein
MAALRQENSISEDLLGVETGSPDADMLNVGFQASNPDTSTDSNGSAVTLRAEDEQSFDLAVTMLDVGQSA